VFLFDGDEYDNIDEYTCHDPSKLNVKKAAIVCNKLISENSELFILSQRCNEMILEMDEAFLYYGEIHCKFKEMANLIKQVQDNPNSINRIKKTALIQNY
jgi:hypothetical protein